MSMRRRQSYVMPPAFSWDWPVSILCLFMGAIGIRLATHPQIWRQVVEQDESRVSVGVVKPLKGGVRLRRAGSSAWQDLTGREEVAQGDSVFTGSGSRAVLGFFNEDRVALGESTLIVVQVDEPAKKDSAEATEGPWWKRVAATVASRVARKAEDQPSRRTVVDVKSGSVDIAYSKASAKSGGLKLRSGGKTIARAGETDRGLRVKIGASGQVSTAQVDARTVGAPPPKEAPRYMAPPEPMSPVYGSRFAVTGPRGVDVPLHWTSRYRGARYEVRIEKVGDESFQITPMASLGGASVNLPPGDYLWKVRSFSDEGSASDWSERWRFAVQPKLEKVDSVGVLTAATGAVSASPEAFQKREALRQKLLQEERERVARAEADKRRAEALKIDAARKAEAQAQARVRDEEQGRRSREIERQRLAEQRLRDIAAQARAESERRRRLEDDERKRRVAAVASASASAPVTRAPAATPASIARYQAIVAAARNRISPGSGDALPALQAKATVAALPNTVKSETTKSSTKLDEENLDYQNLKVQLAWSPVPGTDQYRVTFYKAGQPLKTEFAKDAKYELVVSSMEEVNNLSYQLTARLTSGQEISGQPMAIQVEMTPPNPVEPENEAVTTRSSNLFSWARTVVTDQYVFQVSRDPAFKSGILQKEVTENYVSLSFPSGGTFYWRVRGIAAGRSSEWSKARSIRFSE